MDSVSEEEVTKLLKEEGDKKLELNIIKNMSIENMWLSDLVELEESYAKYKKIRETQMIVTDKQNSKKKSKKTKPKKSKLKIINKE